MGQIISSIVFGVVVAGISVASAGEISGKFNGLITPTGCRSSQKSMFNGTIANGRVIGVAAKGQSFDWELKSDGSFGGNLFLRKHKRGKKMQMYKGKVVGGEISVKAKFGVPGYSQTFCTGAGEFPLK